MGAQKIIQLVNPTSEELKNSVVHFESSLGGSGLHPVAWRGLHDSDSRQKTEPFPKVESHGSYVFGVLSTPTDTDDAKSEYFNIYFVVSAEMVLTVLRGPKESDYPRTASITERITHVLTESDSEFAPGDVVVKIATAVVEDLENVLFDLRQQADRELEELETELFTSNQLNKSSSDIASRYQKVSLLKFEILSMHTTIEETKNVFTVLGETGPDSGMMFLPWTLNQRISLTDLLMRSRSLKAQRADLEDEVHLVFDRLESIENQRQTVAQLRLGAVASILLLPALVVGFFGQNFNVNPWSDHEWAWMLNAGGLASIAIIQFVYFKRKKWL
jgi:Mg2+ and Co2+ transporter CorA